MTVVDFATKGSVFIHTFDNSKLFNLTSGYTLFVVSYTNEFGDPVQLKNDGPSNGYDRKGTILDYIPNIAYGSLKYVDDLSDECIHSKYGAELGLIEEQFHLLSNETDLPKALTYEVCEGEERNGERERKEKN